MAKVEAIVKNHPCACPHPLSFSKDLTTTADDDTLRLLYRFYDSNNLRNRHNDLNNSFKLLTAEMLKRGIQ
jgi:hypothetical protein